MTQAERRCGNCRHWEAMWEDDEEYEKAVPSEFGECRIIGFGGHKFDRLNSNPALAVVTDGEGYQGAFRTREAFGCNLFEAKPSTPEATP